MSTEGSQRDEGFYLCHFELLTLEVLSLHPKGVFPWDTISLSPSCMNKHVFASFLTQILSYKTGFCVQTYTNHVSGRG